jgi:hypothetical protein
MNLSDTDISSPGLIHWCRSAVPDSLDQDVKNYFNDFIEIPYKNQEELAKKKHLFKFRDKVINWNLPVYAVQDNLLVSPHNDIVIDKLYSKMRRGVFGSAHFGYYFYLDDLNFNVKVYYSTPKLERLRGYGLIIFSINERFAGAILLNLCNNNVFEHRAYDLSPDLFRDREEQMFLMINELRSTLSSEIQARKLLEAKVESPDLFRDREEQMLLMINELRSTLSSEIQARKLLEAKVESLTKTNYIKKIKSYIHLRITGCENRLFQRFINFSKEQENIKEFRKIGWFQ